MQCMRCGSKVPLYGAKSFLCRCGGLYDVRHDFSEIARGGRVYWHDVFDKRCRPVRGHAETTSGVWRFTELVMPSIERYNIVTLGEGVMPFWRAGENLRNWVGGNLDLWIMPEGLTPTASFKDFGGTVMVSVAKQSGVEAIGCASTGDTSAMAAAYAAAAGMKCVVVLPKGKVTDAQLVQPLAYGAKVISIPGSFDDCMRVVRELVDAGKMFPANSLNPARIEGHQATVFLAAQFFDWCLPDWFVVPIGNGSNSSSVGKGMRTLSELGLVGRRSRILGTQSEAANPLAMSWGTVQKDGCAQASESEWMKAYKPLEELGDTTATAARIGNPVSAEKVMREVVSADGAVLTVSEIGLNTAVLVAGRDGHFVCPQTGMALAGLRKAVPLGLIRERERVVVVSTAAGIKFPGVVTEYGDGTVLETGSCRTEEIAEAIGV